MARPRVLITGASGLIGGLAIRDLSDSYEFSGLSRHPVTGIPYTVAAVEDYEAIRPAFSGIDMVLHLAGETKNVDSWNDHMTKGAWGTVNVFEAARDAGVRRVVYMSSGSTMCAWEWDDSLPYGKLARGEYDRVPGPWDLLTERTPARPDSPYACVKLFGEACARYFSDAYGMSMIVIRLGAVLASDRPELIRHFPGYLAQADAVQMIGRCLGAPDTIRFGIFDAISDNRVKWRDTTPAKEVLGWHPTGSSDRWDVRELSE